jgi:hypothetical protein
MKESESELLCTDSTALATTTSTAVKYTVRLLCTYSSANAAV